MVWPTLSKTQDIIDSGKLAAGERFLEERVKTSENDKIIETFRSGAWLIPDL